jgi:3-hydroxyisobutyrate dehydrogenase-like beta-hydroxyacid dehydrogenase
MAIERIGFIGLGNMGEPLAANLLRKGFGVLDSAGAGAVVVDCSTSDPASTRMLAARLADRRIGMIDAGLTLYRRMAMRGQSAADTSSIAELWRSAGNR